MNSIYTPIFIVIIDIIVHTSSLSLRSHICMYICIYVYTVYLYCYTLTYANLNLTYTYSLNYIYIIHYATATAWHGMFIIEHTLYIHYI